MGGDNIMSGISEYSDRSANLLNMAARLYGGLSDDRLARRAESDLLRATEDSATEEFVLGFAAQPGVPPPPATVSNGLAAVLFDIQAGNLLIAAGLARGEDAAAKQDGELLLAARQQIAISRGELVGIPVAPLKFDPKLNQRSNTIEGALVTFRDSSNDLLHEIVTEAKSGVLLVGDQISKLDVGPLGDLLGKIGDAIPFGADLGRLVRRGIELVKKAIDGITGLFGKDLLGDARDGVGEVWHGIGDLTDMLFEKLLGVGPVKQHIDTILKGPGLQLERVDRQANALSPLGTSFNSNNKMLRGIIRAIAFAGGLLAWLSVTGPWVVIGLGIAYATVIAAILVSGRLSTGATPAHQPGVEQIADGILTA
jgi:hypothetical protein